MTPARDRRESRSRGEEEAWPWATAGRSSVQAMAAGCKPEGGSRLPDSREGRDHLMRRVFMPVVPSLGQLLLFVRRWWPRLRRHGVKRFRFAQRPGSPPKVSTTTGGSSSPEWSICRGRLPWLPSVAGRSHGTRQHDIDPPRLGTNCCRRKYPGAKRGIDKRHLLNRGASLCNGRIRGGLGAGWWGSQGQPAVG